MTDGDTIINQLPARAFAIPGRYVSGPDLELKTAGDTVLNHQSIGFLKLAMRMQIDEPGRHDEAGCVDFPVSPHPIVANRCNPSVTNSYVAHRIQARFRVHHAATLDDQFILLRKRAA